MTNIREGGCLCGAVRYAVRAEPIRVTICHCTFCQRFTGSAFLVEPIFRAEDVTFSGAAPRTYAHRSDTNGKLLTLHFCERCGTPVCLRLERFPELIGLCAGSFDDPNWFDRKPETTRHIFTRSAQKGVVLPAGVPIYEAHATNADGTVNEARVYAEPVTVK